MNGVNEQDGGNCGKMRVVKRELFERRGAVCRLNRQGGRGGIRGSRIVLLAKPLINCIMESRSVNKS